MVIRRSYLDLPVAQRRAAARAARSRYQDVLSNSTIVRTQEQRQHLQTKLRQLAQWEAGTLPTPE